MLQLYKCLRNEYMNFAANSSFCTKFEADPLQVCSLFDLVYGTPLLVITISTFYEDGN